MPSDTLGEIRRAVAELAVAKKKVLPVNFRVAVRPMSPHCFTGAFPELCSMGFSHLDVIAALDASVGDREQAIGILLASSAAEAGVVGEYAADFPLDTTVADVLSALRGRFPNAAASSSFQKPWVGLFILAEDSSSTYGLPR